MTGNEAHHSSSLTSDQNYGVTVPEFPFLKLPAELRLHIYRNLLHAHCNIRIDEFWADPGIDESSIVEEHVRRPFSSRFAEPFAETFRLAAYRVIATGIHPAILAVNRQTYSEASRIMYSENCFDFCGLDGSSDIWCPGSEALILFLESLSEDSRRHIKHIEFRFDVLTQGLPEPVDYSSWWTPPNQFTEQVFKETCDYLCQNLQLKHMMVKVVDSLGLMDAPASFKDEVIALNEKTWEQHLVPLVRVLDTFEILARTEDGPMIIEMVSEYLKSKLPRTGGPTISTRIFDH